MEKIYNNAELYIQNKGLYKQMYTKFTNLLQYFRLLRILIFLDIRQRR